MPGKSSLSPDPRVLVREARPDDVPGIIRFNGAMALETEGKKLLAETLSAGVGAVFTSNDKGFYVVAEHQSELVGVLMITYEWSDWRNGFFWWIQSVYVRPEYRRKKIYKKLYAFVIERAKSAGNVYGFRLYVERSNVVAQNVYRTLGMQETGYLMFEQDLRE